MSYGIEVLQMTDKSYPAISTEKKSGQELFLNGGNGTNKTLYDFWSWAFSDLVGNTERGKLAEYIVAMAVGAAEGISGSWESYDLRTPDGIRIEVKTSAYLQSWAQKELSQIRFGIRPTHAWDSEENSYDASLQRQADVYVFCVLKHKEQETLNPLDLEQWEFYVLSTNVLNRETDNQKTISLYRVESLGASKSDFVDLSQAIRLQYGKNG